ncbi:MAG TPA: hypothetical protein ENJ76_02115, partial [Oceanithermus sp.]|nr:hypothetical protein [Oceanithermus sp.]
MLVWSAVSFFVLLLELLLTNHTEELQLVGVIAALAGTIAASAAGTLVHLREGAEEKAEYAYEYDEDEVYEKGEGAPIRLRPWALLEPHCSRGSRSLPGSLTHPLLHWGGSRRPLWLARRLPLPPTLDPGGDRNAED